LVLFFIGPLFQGLVRYLEQNFDAETRATRGVVLGYDGRHNSKRFAEVAAAVFLSQGIRVHLFRRLTATPMVVCASSMSLKTWPLHSLLLCSSNLDV
jgi:phosphomannomutase